MEGPAGVTRVELAQPEWRVTRIPLLTNQVTHPVYGSERAFVSPVIRAGSGRVATDDYR
jgi:hypothetical protein